MKKILLSTMLLVGAIAIFSGCTKKSSTPSYTMTANIGSSAFSSSAAAASKSTVGSSTVLLLGGGNGSTTISITLTNYTGAATYTIDGTTNQLAVQTSLTTAHYATSGSVVVSTASSSVLAGTFNAVLDDSTKVTSGNFSVKAP